MSFYERLVAVAVVVLGVGCSPLYYPLLVDPAKVSAHLGGKTAEASIPLGSFFIKEVLPVGEDALVMHLVRAPALKEQEVLKRVSLRDQGVVWEKSLFKAPFEGSAGTSTVLFGTPNQLGVLHHQRDDQALLTVVHTATGELKSRFKVPAGSSLLFLDEEAGRIGLHSESTKEVGVYQLDTGEVVHRQFGVHRAARASGDTFLFQGDGISRVDSRGSPLWHYKDRPVDQSTLPPWEEEGRVWCVDNGGALLGLDASTGRLATSGVSLAALGKVSAVESAGKGRMLVRYTTSGHKGGVALVSPDTAKVLWRVEESAPFISNVVHKGESLFVASETTLFALDLSEGTVRWKQQVIGTAGGFPVQLRLHGETVSLVGELVIAGYAADAGEKVYWHGFDGVGNTSLPQLNGAIRTLQRRLGMPAGGNAMLASGQALFQLSQKMQAQTSALSRLSSKARYFERDSWKAFKYSQQAEISNHFSRSFGLASLSLSAMGAGLELQSARLAVEAELQLLEQRLLRNSILRFYPLYEQGEYVYRPVHEYFGVREEVNGVAVIHLPTGRQKTVHLSAPYLYYGLFTVVDCEAGKVLYHGVKGTGEAEEYDETDTSGKRALIGYLKERAFVCP